MFFSVIKKITFVLIVNLIVFPVFFLQSKLAYARTDEPDDTGNADSASADLKPRGRFASLLFSYGHGMQANISGILNRLSIKVYCGLSNLFADACNINGTTTVAEIPQTGNDINVQRADSVFYDRTENRAAPAQTAPQPATGADSRRVVIEKVIERITAPIGVVGITQQYLDARLAALASELRNEFAGKTVTVKTADITDKQIDNIYENVSDKIDNAIDGLNDFSEDEIVDLILANSSSVGTGAAGYVLQSTGTTSQWVATSTLGITQDLNALDLVAVGTGNTASGDYASALGHNNVASSSYTTASGYYNRVTQVRATAMGYDNRSSGVEASSFGTSNLASGDYSSASGYYNRATGHSSAAFGFSNLASGTRSFAFGGGNSSSADYASAFGYLNEATAEGATALGYDVTNNIANSVMIGPSDSAKITILSSGNLGIGTTTPGDRLSVAGSVNLTGALKISGNAGTSGYVLQTTGTTAQWVATSTLGITQDLNALSAVAVGSGNTASGFFGASAFGIGNTASGSYASAFGYGNVVSGYRGIGAGYSNTVSGYYSTAVGLNNTASGYKSSAVGFENASANYFATAIGYGNTASGIRSSASGYLNVASADSATASGYSNTASANYSSAFGVDNTASGNYSSAFGFGVTATGTDSVAFGNRSSANAINAVVFGTRNFSSANGQGSVSLGVLNNSYNATIIPSTGAITGTALATTTVGRFSTAVGVFNRVTGELGAAFGYNNIVRDGNGVAVGSSNLIHSATNKALAVGSNNTVTANVGMAFGDTNTVSGAFASAIGFGNTSSGSSAVAFGYQNQASTNSGGFGRSVIASNGSYGFGYAMNLSGATAFAYGYNLNSTVAGVTIGKDITNSTANSLQIGMGDSAKMSILTTGQFGIGTTTPAARFAVTGTAGTGDIFAIASSTNARLLTVTAAGNVGIGTSTPGQKLAVVGSGQFTGVGSGAYAFDLNLTADGTLTTSASDARLKENVERLDSAETLEKLMRLKPSSFDWKSNGAHDIGLIAQQVEEIFPELVFTNKTDGYKGINYSRLPALLLSGMQEINGMFDSFVEYVEDGVAYINEIVVKRFTAKQITVRNEDLYKTGVTIYDQKTGEPICMFVYDGKVETEPGACEDRKEPEEEENENQDEQPNQTPDGSGEQGGGGQIEAPVPETTESAVPPEDESETDNMAGENGDQTPVDPNTGSDTPVGTDSSGGDSEAGDSASDAGGSDGSASDGSDASANDDSGSSSDSAASGESSSNDSGNSSSGGDSGGSASSDGDSGSAGGDGSTGA